MMTFGKTTTAEQVLAGLDLTGQTIALTGCASGIGFEAMRTLAAHGAHVIGTARSHRRAAEACARVSGRTTPIACDQSDLASVAAAAVVIRALGEPLDAIIANAGIMVPPGPDVRYGVESQFLVNHLSHMLLVTRLADLLRAGSGRIVMVSSSAAQAAAPKQGIAFDDLAARKGYKKWACYGQSKLANIAFAKSMAERLRPSGVTANALHPGIIVNTGLFKAPGVAALALPVIRLFSKSIPQGAATHCYLAAHPEVAGATGGFYADCRPAKPNPHADDPAFRERLWAASEAILAEHAPA